VVSRQNADISDTLHLRDVAMATVFVFVYMGCTLAHLANTVHVCSEAALCQITLTTIVIITGSIARIAKRRYKSNSEGDFAVFHPAGATRCSDGSEIWLGGVDATFHCHRCNDKSVGLQN